MDSKLMDFFSWGRVSYRWFVGDTGGVQSSEEFGDRMCDFTGCD